MRMNDYQALAQRTSRKNLDKQAHLFNGLMGLCGEAGECIDLAKKHFFQDHRPIEEELLDELGDVLWYIAETASALGIDLDTIARHNIAKLARRYPEGFDEERSLHREPGKEA